MNSVTCEQCQTCLCRSCDVWGVCSAAVDVVGVSAGVVRVEDVSGEMLGFLSRRRLLPEAVWRPAGLDHSRTCVTSRNSANSVETLSVWTFALDSNVCFTVFRSKKAQHVAFFDPKTIAQRFSVFFEKLWGFRTTSPPVYAQESYFSVWRAWCQKRVGRSSSDSLSCLPRRDDEMPNKNLREVPYLHYIWAMQDVRFLLMWVKGRRVEVCGLLLSCSRLLIQMEMLLFGCLYVVALLNCAFLLKDK